MSKVTTSSGIGFPGLLTVLFIGLKLTNYIDWSWFWVLSPIIFSVILGITMITTVLLIGGSRR